jgi:hypothetical protein
MLTIIICIGLGIFFEFRIFKTGSRSLERTLFWGFLGLIVGLLSATVLAMAFGTNTENLQLVGKTKLVAIAGVSSEINGTFILATGDVNSNQYYKFYYKLANGGYKFGKVSADNTTIYEDDGTDSYLEEINKINKLSGLASWFTLPISEDVTMYAIHVPKGTVKVEHKLDLR